MRRLLSWTVVLLMLTAVCAPHASAQFGPKTILKFGYNWSTLSGDAVDDAESWKAATGGIGLELDLLIVSLQIDLLYSPRGAEIPETGTVKLHYVSFPVVVKKKFFPVGIHPYILGGLEFSYMISAKQADNNIKENLRSDDLGLVLGAGLEFSLLGKGALIEGRYFYGLGNINQEGEFMGVANRTYQFGIGLIL